MANYHFKFYAFVSCWAGVFGCLVATSWLTVISETATKPLLLPLFVLGCSALALGLGLRLLMCGDIKQGARLQFQICASCGSLLSISWQWLSGTWSFVLLALLGYSIFVFVNSRAHGSH